MIARGSMVVLKGHHRWPMVVVQVTDERGHPAGRISRMPPADEDGPVSMATVAWIDGRGVPQRASYGLDLLEEIDG